MKLLVRNIKFEVNINLKISHITRNPLTDMLQNSENNSTNIQILVNFRLIKHIPISPKLLKKIKKFT